MRHPLVNQSLTPFGFTSIGSQTRLDYRPKLEGGINRERIIAKLWANWNREQAPLPLPAEVIIHEQLPAMGSRLKITEGEFMFRGKPYVGRDIAVLSSAVQWLATSVGENFLYCKPMGFSEVHPEREFREKFKIELEQSHRLLPQFTHHVCVEECKRKPDAFDRGYMRGLWFDPHYYGKVTDRDRAVVDSLMWWLGRVHGRAFIAAYTAKKNRAVEATRFPSRQHWEEERLRIRGGSAPRISS